MTKLIVRLPQMGEGLQEAKILTRLKAEGESVERDEPLFQMETDKAVVEIESTWLCEEGDMVAIGAPVVSISAAVDQTVDASDTEVSNQAEIDLYSLKTGPSWAGNTFRKSGSERELPQERQQSHQSLSDSTSCPVGGAWTPISSEQAALIRHMTRVQNAMPATVEKRVKWPHMRKSINAFQAKHDINHVTMFEYFALSVSRTAIAHPRFRSHIVGSGLCTHDTLDLGVAVALPNDELSTAVVKSANQLTPGDFIRTLRSNVKSARKGDIQVNSVTQLHLSSLGSLGIDFAIPILVPPSIGTIFLGTPTEVDGETQFSIVLTFDHRAINGVGAAQFLRDLAVILLHADGIS